MAAAVAGLAAAAGAAVVVLLLFGGAVGGRTAEAVAATQGASRAVRPFWRQEPSSPLYAAAADGDLPLLRELLSAGVSPNLAAGPGWTPLMSAARAGQVDAIELLVARGAEVERRDARNGWTPLFHAIHKNQPAAVRALIAAGADVNARARSRATPLIMAAAEGEAEVVEMLLAAGADPHARGSGAMNALLAAEVGGDPRVESALLRAAPDLPQRTDRTRLRMVRTIKWVITFVRGGRHRAMAGTEPR